MSLSTSISFGSQEQQLLIATNLLLKSGEHGGRERYGTYRQYEPIMTRSKISDRVARRVIKLVTAPGDIVLDCFMGSGTTAVAQFVKSKTI